jgi:hypothetical protein
MAEDPHSLCTEGVSNWSLLQLAALPILAEAQLINDTNPEVFRQFACLTEVSLIQNDPDVTFPSKSILEFDSADHKLALGIPAIGFDHDSGPWNSVFRLKTQASQIVRWLPLWAAR